MEAPILPAPIWVSTSLALDKMVARLDGQSAVAVDTESNSLFAYQEQVCLIQFSIPGYDFLLDPLALPDLSLLAPVFADHDTQKVFHAAEYDIICLKRDYDFKFNNIFDTMQAVRILGRKEVGLGNVLEAEFGIQLEKRYQRANWGERPLSAAMLSYARLDTHYLLALRDRLSAELEERGLTALAREDFARLTQVSASNGENGPGSCWRIAGSRDLNARQCAVLQALLEYRDQQAQRFNLPHFKVLSNQILMDIASSCPQTADDLGQATKLSARQRDRHTNGLLRAVRLGMQSSPPPKPVNHRPNDQTLERMEILREWRKSTAKEWKVESDVILPRETLETIASSRVKNLKDLETIMGSQPFRFENFGPQILRAITEGKKP